MYYHPRSFPMRSLSMASPVLLSDISATFSRMPQQNEDCRNNTGRYWYSHYNHYLCSVEIHTEESEYEFVDVVNDDLAGDFFHLNQEFSGFQITPELSFQHGECGFNQLSSSVFWIIRLQNHFFSIRISNDFILPEPGRDDRVSIQVLSDESMNIIRVISTIHDITI